MERVMGIEPTQPAWKAGILPLNNTRVWCLIIITHSNRFVNTFLKSFLNFFNFFRTLAYPKKQARVRGIYTMGVPSGLNRGSFSR